MGLTPGASEKTGPLDRFSPTRKRRVSGFRRRGKKRNVRGGEEKEIVPWVAGGDKKVQFTRTGRVGGRDREGGKKAASAFDISRDGESRTGRILGTPAMRQDRKKDRRETRLTKVFSSTGPDSISLGGGHRKRDLSRKNQGKLRE